MEIRFLIQHYEIHPWCSVSRRLTHFTKNSILPHEHFRVDSHFLLLMNLSFPLLNHLCTLDVTNVTYMPLDMMLLCVNMALRSPAATLRPWGNKPKDKSQRSGGGCLERWENLRPQSHVWSVDLIYSGMIPSPNVRDETHASAIVRWVFCYLQWTHTFWSHYILYMM